MSQVVDLREPWMYEQDRIRDSINIPFEEVECRMDEIDQDGTVVFYCDRGVKSMLVCRALWKRGYHAVDLAGGMLQYRGKYIDRSPWSALE